MQNPNEAMTQAFDGYVGEIAIEIGITDKRIYEILGRDNPYPKLWRLLNPLGRLNPDRLGLVQADFNARCRRIYRPFSGLSNPASLHQQVSEAVTAILANAPRCDRKKEILEAIAELQKELEMCD